MADESNPEFGKKCAGCNKPIKRSRRYYRNNKYYCNKNCWKTKSKAPAKE